MVVCGVRGKLFMHMHNDRDCLICYRVGGLYFCMMFY